MMYLGMKVPWRVMDAVRAEAPRMVGEVGGRASTSGIVTDLSVGWMKVKQGKRMM